MCSSGLSDGEYSDFTESRRVIDKLRQRYRFIKQELHPDDKIVDVLYQERFIRSECRRQVLTLKTSDISRTNDLIIKDLVRNLERIGDNEYEERERFLFEKFSECESLYLLEGEMQFSDDENEHEYKGPELTDTDLIKVLQNESNTELLKDDLEPLRIIDQLLVEDVLSFEDHENIRNTGSRIERVTILLELVKRDVCKKCKCFLKAIHSCKPALLKRLLRNRTGTERKGLTIRVQPCHSTSCRHGTTVSCDLTIRLRFNADSFEITSVEHEVVNSTDPGILDMEAMECDTTVESFSFSSVVVRLRAHSQRAAAMLQERLISDPEGLSVWLNQLLTEQQKHELKEVGWNTVLVEIGAVPITQDCTCLTCHYALTQAVKQPDLPKIEQIEMFLKEVRSEKIDKEQKDVTTKLVDMTGVGSQTRDFLHFLLGLSQSYRCRFDLFLKTTGQQNVLNYLKNQNSRLALTNLTKDEILENRTFLSHEGDPRMFLHILSEDEQSIVKAIVSRRQRFLTFLKILTDSDDCEDNIRKFEAELRRQKLFRILKILRSSIKSKNAERARIYGPSLKHKLLENKKMIADEVDIELLKSTFIDRKIVSEEQFDLLTKHATRRDCVLALLKEVLEGGYAAMICLISALNIAGYNYIAGTIENTTDPILQCPCLSPPTQPGVFAEAKFTVSVETVDQNEKPTPPGSSGNGTNDDTGNSKHSNYPGMDVPTSPEKRESADNAKTENSVRKNEQLLHYVQSGEKAPIDKTMYINKWLNESGGHHSVGLYRPGGVKRPNRRVCDMGDPMKPFVNTIRDSTDKPKTRNRKEKCGPVIRLINFDRIPGPLFY